MKLGREVSRHNELDNWRNTHRFESVMATTWLLLTISETEPGLWDRLWGRRISCPAFGERYAAVQSAEVFNLPVAREAGTAADYP